MKWDGNNLRGLIGWALLAALLVLLAGHLADRRAISPKPETVTELAAGGNEAKRRAANSEDKWEEVAAFMRVNSPAKLAAFDKLPDAAKAPLRAQLIARYNELSKLPNNSGLREIEVDRVQIEDVLFAELSKRKQAHAKGEFSPDYIRAVARLLENRMRERKVRAENLAAQVKEDESLQKDPARWKAFVQQRAQFIEKNGLGAGQGLRRRLEGQPATAESEEELSQPAP
jgi:hypothetical protein